MTTANHIHRALAAADAARAFLERTVTMKRTMTVGELIAELERFNDDTPVVLAIAPSEPVALYGAVRPEDANDVCALLPGGKFTEREAEQLAAMSEGDYAEAVGLY